MAYLDGHAGRANRDKFISSDEAAGPSGMGVVDAAAQPLPVLGQQVEVYRMKVGSQSIRLPATLGGIFWRLWLLTGCQPSGPYLENKPPPEGGPPANSRRPPRGGKHADNALGCPSTVAATVNGSAQLAFVLAEYNGIRLVIAFMSCAITSADLFSEGMTLPPQTSCRIP